MNHEEYWAWVNLDCDEYFIMYGRPRETPSKDEIFIARLKYDEERTFNTLWKMIRKVRSS